MTDWIGRAYALILFGLVSLVVVSCSGGGGQGGASTNPPLVARYYPNGAQIPVSGPDVPGAAAFDQAITDFMRRSDVPGAAVAVAKDGKLLLARGYGYADFEAKQPVQPDSMFRIGSVSKVLTSLAILRLRDQGRLDLDQTFSSVLTDYQIGPGGDARLGNVTLRNLLQHSGGWDRGIAGDILFQSNAVSTALGVPRPVSNADVIRYTMDQPLQFAPGTRFAYSNIGFIILGRVIEKASGQSYERFVRDQVLAPLGVHAMSIGPSHLAQRGASEVKYYPHAGDSLVVSEFPDEGRVLTPYQFDMARLDAAGGWIASPIDLTRAIAALDGVLTPGFLSADSLGQLLAPPPFFGSGGYNFVGSTWYGFGISVGPTTQTYGHGGALPGTAASIVHHASGYAVAVLLNTQGGNEPLYFNVVAVVTQALDTGFAGSPTDLYLQYPSPNLPASGP